MGKLSVILQNVRDKHPLIHNITNYVTVNDVANVLLACGASPIMADDQDEASEITEICSGLNINIGTLNSRTIPSMLIAGRRANELGHATVLDPVGAGASGIRTQTALRLLKEVRFDVVRGNISEISTLETGFGTTKGVDADIGDTVTNENLRDKVKFVKQFATELGCIVSVSGAIDLVTDGVKCWIIRNGRPEMSRITGTGCQLSAVTAACLAANPDNKLDAAAAAVCIMGVAGEIGQRNMRPEDGNATYRNRIIDAIYNMTGDELNAGALFEIV